MYEQAKIDEAKYFLTQMKAVVTDRTAFNHNLSAFLAAARSALQYALKEAQPKSGGQAWYDAQVAAQHTVKFFKDKRDISIHASPILPSATIGISVTDTIHMSDSLSVTIRRKDGTVEEERSLGASPPPPPPEESEPSVSYEYSFSDWPGNEDVIALCQSYITEVETIVSDGVAKGHLTP